MQHCILRVVWNMKMLKIMKTRSNGIWQPLKETLPIPRPTNQLAITYNVLKREEDSMRELGEALRLNPGLSEARYYLAQALAMKGKCPEAQNLIHQAPSWRPEFSQILNYCESQK
jgi:hypothetical protein